MGYYLIKKIRIEDNKVLLTFAESNVRPRIYEEHEVKQLSNILMEKGQEALDIEILKAFEIGDFQGKISKYSNALEILRHLPEYKPFDWRNNFNDCILCDEKRKSEAFTELLKKALASKLPKERYVISKTYQDQKVWALKKIRCIKWVNLKEFATKFKFKEDAEEVKNCFTSSEHWSLENL